VTALVPLAAESVRIAFRPTKMKKYLSTAVQVIVSEDVKANTVTVIAESDLADPKLFHVLAGHLVNGAGMCSSNLYADMAYTICRYACNLLKPGEKVDINIGTMDTPAPLLLKNINEPEEQIVRITIKVDLDAQKADFTVTANNGKKDVIHAKSIIIFEDSGLWQEEWNRTSYLVQSRIDLLQHKMENGEANKVGRATAYKLFGALVDYSDTFQGMHSVVFDGAEFEAASNIKFRAGPDNGDFYFNPYFLDSACHLSGFIVNATVNPQEECYINHGWSSLRFIAPLEQDQQYIAYVKMQLVPGSKMRVGDVYVFNSNKEVIGLAGGVRFQCIPRKLMNVLLPKSKAGGKVALPSAPVVKPTPAPEPQAPTTP
jgi:iterative type I PKS product template protein